MLVTTSLISLSWKKYSSKNKGEMLVAFSTCHTLSLSLHRTSSRLPPTFHTSAEHLNWSAASLQKRVCLCVGRTNCQTCLCQVSCIYNLLVSNYRPHVFHVKAPCVVLCADMCASVHYKHIHQQVSWRRGINQANVNTSPFKQMRWPSWDSWVCTCVQVCIETHRAWTAWC